MPCVVPFWIFSCLKCLVPMSLRLHWTKYSLIYHSIGIASYAIHLLCVAKLPPRIVYLCRLIHLPRKNTFLFSIATASVTPRILCSFKASACPWNWVEQSRQCRQDSVRLKASTHSEIQLELERVAILGWVGYKCFTTVSHLNHPKWKVRLRLAVGSISAQEHKQNL